MVAQNYIASVWTNTVFKAMGVRNWVLEFRQPNIAMEQEKHRLWLEWLKRGALTINEVRGQLLSLPPIEGGNTPFINVPGQGLAPVAAALKASLQSALTSAGGRPGKAPGTPKMPPKGSLMPKDEEETTISVKMANDLIEFLDLVEKSGSYPMLEEGETDGTARGTV